MARISPLASHTFLAGLALICVAVGALASEPAVTLPDGTVIVGSWAMIENSAVEAYLGIPYADPPVGDLRWRPPGLNHKPASPIAANTFRAFCPQQEGNRNTPKAEKTEVLGKEDCLYLNVWTPARHHLGKLPVLVWIHGGGFVRGSTSDPRFNGQWLAGQGLVVVTISYRLGVLGVVPPITPFIDEAKTGAFPGAVNLGLMDQIMALRWVHDNIASFGGDSENVTVAGSSAGGASVGYLLSNPSVIRGGLFAKAIMSSSGGGGRKPIFDVAKGELPADYQRLWQSALDTFVVRQPCNASTDPQITPDKDFATVESEFGLARALRNCVTAQDLVAAFGNTRSVSGDLTIPEYRDYPFFDRKTVVAPSQVDGFAAAATSRLPLLMGFAHDEATNLDNRGFPLQRGTLLKWLRQAGVAKLRTWSDVVQLYPGENNDRGLLRSVYADLAYHWPQQIIACLHSQQEDNVYVYEFNYRSPQRKRGSDSGAGHSEDAVWLFGGPLLAVSAGFGTTPLVEVDSQFATLFARAVIEFIKTGKPTTTGSNSFNWPSYMPGMSVVEITSPQFHVIKEGDAKRVAAIRSMAETYKVVFSAFGCSR